MSLTTTTLGNRLRQSRLNVGMTQEDAANQADLPRTTLVQIEAGNRNVSSLELVTLAKLYHQDISKLLSESEETDENPLVALCRVREEFATSPELQNTITNCLAIFREGVDLARFIGDRPRVIAPTYELPAMRNYTDAVDQGEAMATEERKRLNLGMGPIADIAEVIATQGIWASASPSLPDDLSGLFLHSPDIGMGIIVNENHNRGRRRFSYAHEYAHSLADRKTTVSVTDKQNAHDLIERRANAFAGEFLMPAQGVFESLDRLNKGAGSRETKWLWNVVTEEGESAEKRNAPGSQTIGYQDIAYLATEYAVSYETALYRLIDMRVISRVQLDELKDKRADAVKLMELLEMFNPDKNEPEQPRLRQQIGQLAVEAFRRGAISGGRLLDVCDKLGIAEAESLLALAKATA